MRFNDGLKVLGYGNFQKMGHLMDRMFTWTFDATADHITSAPRSIEDLNRLVRAEKVTHVLVPDEAFHQLESGKLGDCVVPVVEYLLDHWVPWAVAAKNGYMVEQGIRHAVVRTGRFLEPYDRGIQFHVVHAGFHESEFQDLNLDRDIDVGIHGSLGADTSPSVYPVRNWLAEWLPGWGERKGYRVEYREHPGYWSEQGSHADEHAGSYARWLNRCRIATGGTSKWNITIQKYYEVPGCGCILLGDLPADDSDFFRGRILEIDPSRIGSKRYSIELGDTLQSCLDNYAIRKELLSPFRSPQDRFDRSFDGRALAIRRILKELE